MLPPPAVKLLRLSTRLLMELNRPVADGNKLGKFNGRGFTGQQGHRPENPIFK